MVRPHPPEPAKRRRWQRHQDGAPCLDGQMQMQIKKSITRVAALALGIALSQGVSANTVQLAPTAPDSYVVVRGDTLWDIAGRFLEKPWRWPEIWEGNKASIKDPHWIYPGDVIYLDRSGTSPKLRVGRQISSSSAGQRVVLDGRASGKNATGKLQPMVLLSMNSYH